MATDIASIIFGTDDLLNLADILEKELAAWPSMDGLSGHLARQEKQKRSALLWRYASESGVVIAKLCAAGAFDKFSHIKDHLGQLREEFKNGLNESKPPGFAIHSAPHVPPAHDDGYDGFFAVLFEGFCRQWATSPAEPASAARREDYLKQARYFIKLMKAASLELLPRPPGSLSSGKVRLQFARVIPGDRSRGLVPAYHFRILLADGSEVGHLNFRVGDTDHVRQSVGHIGYGILEPFRGNGFALQACRAVAPFAHTIYHGVHITCDPDNHASRRTIERLGATFEGEFPVPPNDPQFENGSRIKRHYRWLADGLTPQA